MTLENNTITTSNCASSASGSGGGTETTTRQETDRARKRRPWAEKRLPPRARGTTTGSGSAATTPGVGAPHRHRRPAQRPRGRPCAIERITRRSTTDAIGATVPARPPPRTHRRARRFPTGGAHSPAEHRLAGRVPARHHGSSASRPARPLPPASRLAYRRLRNSHRFCAPPRRTPRARGRLPAGRVRARHQADHRRADHAAGDRHAHRPGRESRWLKVMLPGRPNGSTGWIAQAGHAQARDRLAHPGRTSPHAAWLSTATAAW